MHKCSKCDRTFKHAANLGRHMTATHGTKKKAKKATRRRRRGALARAKRRKALPSRVVPLKNMSLDQLINLIGEAKKIARLRIEELGF